jgi:hypothetical protein
MRMITILLASAAVAILAVSATAADARSRHRTKQDIKEDEITRQLNLEQLSIARGTTMPSTPSTTNEDQSDMEPADKDTPDSQQPANRPSTY